MTRRIVLPFLLLYGLAGLSGCGKKGPIQVPLVRTPQTVQDFSVRQRGREVLLSWTNPQAAIDGNPIEGVAEVEVWLIKEDRRGEGEVKKWTKEGFEDKAERLTRISTGQFSKLRAPEAGGELGYVYLPEDKDFGQKILIFSLRAGDKKRRMSAFSEPLSLGLLTPPDPPQRVQAVVFEDHIEVGWEDPERGGEEGDPTIPRGYDVYRSEGESRAVRLNPSLLMKPEYRDADFTFGSTYRYSVRTVLTLTPPLESEASEAVEITARDVFPPARPSGLTAIGGSGFIALSWETGPEPDLAGYRVWRRIDGKGDFILIANLKGGESAFQDAMVEKNKRYEYAITALDGAGNESAKSESARGIMRDSPPE